MGRMVLVRVVAVATLVSACGSSDGDDDGRGGAGANAGAGQGGGATGMFDAGSDPGRNNVAAGAVCQRLAEIDCAGEQACCSAPGRTLETCISRIKGACQNQLMLDMISAAPQVAFDAAGASAAFAELERRASMCDPSVAAWAFSADGFSSTFTGTLGNGEDCEPTGGLEAPIDQLYIALASCRIGDGLACLPGESGWTCSPRAAVGGRCYNDLNCAAGAYCDNPEGEFNGMCVAAKASGDCDGPLQCASLICSDGMCAASGDAQAAYCFD